VLCNEPLHLDWESLREEIKTHGLRNSTLTALMPSETSSQISNATNGIEPPRGLVSRSRPPRTASCKQVVPEYHRLKDQYELLWKQPSVDGYLQLVGIMQKFVDQAISANTNYDPARFRRQQGADEAAAQGLADRLQIRPQDALLSQHP
jgi:ribonucleoside-diphosphate reductase alpha chain